MKISEVPTKTLNAVVGEAAARRVEGGKGHQLEVIKRNTSITKRLGRLALHHAADIFGHEKILRLYEQPYIDAGLDVLGHGFSATVTQAPGEDYVRKIIRGSDNLSDPDRTSLARNLESQIAITEQHLPEFLLPTDVVVAKSPISDGSVIQLLQPKVTFVGEELNPTDMKGFAEISLADMATTGYLPDVLGEGNLVNTAERGIQLIDPVPVSKERDWNYTFNAEKLGEMALTGKN